MPGLLLGVLEGLGVRLSLGGRKLVRMTWDISPLGQAGVLFRPGSGLCLLLLM